MPTGQARAASCDLETYRIWLGLGSPTVCDNHLELEEARLIKEQSDENQIADEVKGDSSSIRPSFTEAKSEELSSESDKPNSTEAVLIDNDLSAAQPATSFELTTTELAASEDETYHLDRSYFAKAFGGFGSQSARVNEPGSDVKMGGVIGGVDLFSNDWLSLGLIGMYAQIHVDVKGDDEKVDISSLKLGGQASMEWGSWHLDSLFLYGPEFTNASRVASISGSEYKLTNDYTNHRVTQAFELGYTERLGSLIIQPFAGMELDWHYQSKASEKGHNSAGVLIKKSTHWSGETKLGFALSTEMMIGDVPVVPTIAVSWHHRFGTLSNTTSMSFDSGLTYERVGASPSRGAAEVQASLGFNLRPNMVLNMGYSGRFDRSEKLHSGSIGFRIDF
jgi:uncharacterized protein with beta-barrel porin domain